VSFIGRHHRYNQSTPHKNQETMRDLPAAEARSMLSNKSLCECDGEWSLLITQPGTFTIQAGLTDADGVGRQMEVSLNFRRSAKTGILYYKFTVFKRHPYGLERVYQLDIVQSRRPIKDVHKRSHEHMGDCRIDGNASWDNWSFDDVLLYFCQQTNIDFSPPPPDPEEYRLKG
jgi:hypothetical protein